MPDQAKARLYVALNYTDPDDKGWRDYELVLIPAHSMQEAIEILMTELTEWNLMYITTDAYFEEADAAGAASIAFPLTWTYQRVAPNDHAAWLATMPVDVVADGKPRKALYHRVPFIQQQVQGEPS